MHLMKTRTLPGPQTRMANVGPGRAILEECVGKVEAERMLVMGPEWSAHVGSCREVLFPGEREFGTVEWYYVMARLWLVSKS
jgi:hypothetical protein